MVVRVTKVNRYQSFRQMLEGEGVEACLPGVRGVDAGARIYDGIPGYSQRAMQFGVLAIHIERV